MRLFRRPFEPSRCEFTYVWSLLTVLCCCAVDGDDASRFDEEERSARNHSVRYRKASSALTSSIEIPNCNSSRVDDSHLIVVLPLFLSLYRIILLMQNVNNCEFHSKPKIKSNRKRFHLFFLPGTLVGISPSIRPFPTSPHCSHSRPSRRSVSALSCPK